MSKICDNCEDPSWTGQDPIVAPELPSEGGGGGTSDFNSLSNRPKYGGVTISGSTDIPNIEGIIPNAASNDNQLADKNFVNSSVATNTANFVGTYDSVAELEAVQNPTNNDYGFVVSTDASGNTVYNRYKYNEDQSGWLFEYSLNNSSFTSDQWAAINSGITSGNVEKVNEIVAIKSIGSGLGLDENGVLSLGSTVKTLTSADANWPVNNPTGIALWLLEPGIYIKGDGTDIWFCNGTSQSQANSTIDSSWPNFQVLFIVAPALWNSSPTSDTKNLYAFSSGYAAFPNYGCLTWSVYTSSGNKTEYSVFRTLNSQAIQDNLTSTATGLPLSAKQGKVLKDTIDGLVIKGAGAPTTSTVGTVGKLYEDTTNGKLYQCVDATNPYVWAEVGGGGGGNVNCRELTSADYNYPTDNPTTVALWLLDPGVYWWDWNFADTGGITFLSSDSSTPFKNATLRSFCTQVIIGNDVSGIRNIQCLARNSDYDGYGVGYTDIIPYRVRTNNGTIVNPTGASMPLGAGDVFSDPVTRYNVAIKGTATHPNGGGISIFGTVSSQNGMAIGASASASATSAIAVGAGATANVKGQMSINANWNQGYNDTNYRLLSGLYDGQGNHDAATVAQGNRLMTDAPTTSDEGVLGQLWTDTAGMHTYQCTAIDDTDPNAIVYTWTQRW